MVTVALLVRLEAKPGKEADVESFLRAGLSLIQEEAPKTASLYIGLLDGLCLKPYATYTGTIMIQYLSILRPYSSEDHMTHGTVFFV